jgi:enolase-phosphatase E1
MIYRVRAVLLDIEGTTGSIAFVHDVLFPYARARLKAYVAAHAGEVAPLLQAVREVEVAPQLTDAETADRLLIWMGEDRKATPLKALQGLIWRDGYEGGALQGHVYPDAEQAMRRWHEAGLSLFIYSSGSVAAQKLLFGHSVYGDLTPLLSGYFDTEVGPKQEPASYRTIAARLGLDPQAILFLSDNPDEIGAATAADMPAVLVRRDGAPGVASFDQIAVRLRR